MLGGEGYALKMARDMFVKDLTRAQAAEKQHCARTHQDAQMSGAIYNKICDLVVKCESFYEVEALARFVFDENYIPEMGQLKARGQALRKVVPIFDTLKATRNPRRSF